MKGLFVLTTQKTKDWATRTQLKLERVPQNGQWERAPEQSVGEDSRMVSGRVLQNGQWEGAPEWSVGGCSRIVNGRELQYGQWERTPEWYVFLASLVAPIVLLLLQSRSWVMNEDRTWIIAHSSPTQHIQYQSSQINTFRGNCILVTTGNSVICEDRLVTHMWKTHAWPHHFTTQTIHKL
jgi:hypothetical protein